MRLIDAETLIEQTNLLCTRYEVRWTDNRVMVWIDNAPTVDAVPVVHGRWENGKCQHCGFDLRCLTDGENDLEQWVWDEGFNHCPSCGAKMDGDGNAKG